MLTQLAQSPPGLGINSGGAAEPVCQVIKMSADDNILNVVDASLGLLADALPFFDKAGVAPHELQPLLEPVAMTLLMKTADTNTHLADRSADGFVALASAHAVGGVGFVAPMALRELPRRVAGVAEDGDVVEGLEPVWFCGTLCWQSHVRWFRWFASGDAAVLMMLLVVKALA